MNRRERVGHDEVAAVGPAALATLRHLRVRLREQAQDPAVEHEADDGADHDREDADHDATPELRQVLDQRHPSFGRFDLDLVGHGVLAEGSAVGKTVDVTATVCVTVTVDVTATRACSSPRSASCELCSSGTEDMPVHRRRRVVEHGADLALDRVLHLPQLAQGPSDLAVRPRAAASGRRRPGR